MARGLGQTLEWVDENMSAAEMVTQIAMLNIEAELRGADESVDDRARRMQGL